MSKRYRTHPGLGFPPGATHDALGTNFSVFSRYATGAELLLYEAADSRKPFQVITLDPEVNRTFFYWHVYVEELPPGVHYTWRMDGPGDTERTGFRYNRNKELVDPWARAVTDSVWERRPACDPQDASHTSMRAMVVADIYDWEGDRPLNRPLQDSILYEMHVRGFTRHPAAGVTYPGTFTGLIEKIPYLKELGITEVELMPVMAFDEQDVADSVAARGNRNYWGYSPHSFWSPHPGYCVTPAQGTHQRELRDMVKALHRAGIGVILDVVFNHTAEGGAGGPWINFRGFGNEIFYQIDPADRRRYRDFTGCGNTINCNHPLVAIYLTGCLKYWVRELHVDGFRFDLASVLVRGEDGQPIYNAPVPWYIEGSALLAHTKLIAEAWDAGGLYQVGAFPGFRWAEWNGRYRDVIRRFVRGDRGLVGEVATRLSGSSDLYQPGGRLPINSVNFITCHDGFTLYDLVSYNTKHNEANGEDNRDGTNDHLSWNCGAEGDTDDPQILALRHRQAKNFTAILLLSIGVPMLLAGDEVLRTQRGNNNAYCQDNEISWLDWRLTGQNRDMLRFCRGMIALRKRHRCLRRQRFLTSRVLPGARLPEVSWHGVNLSAPPWLDREAQFLAYTLAAMEPDEEDLHIILNMSQETLAFEIPSVRQRRWHRAVDSGMASPQDILEPADQPAAGKVYHAAPRTVVVLESRPHRSQTRP